MATHNGAESPLAGAFMEALVSGLSRSVSNDGTSSDGHRAPAYKLEDIKGWFS
jgi:hypothetical protein